MSNDQRDSDQLPYVQFDRSAKPKAALLAQHLGVTLQHAIGSMIEFWDLASDPRQLEAQLRANKRAVVLDDKSVRLRFRLASGHDIDPAVLETLGLLERTSEGYRVRGMSRQLGVVERRLQAREAAGVGGKRSAQVRKERLGTAQPRSSLASNPVRQPLERTASAPEATPEATAEATPEATPNTEDRGQRSEDNGHRSEKNDRSRSVELSGQQTMWESWEAKRREWCLERGIEPGASTKHGAGYINKVMSQALREALNGELVEPGDLSDLFDWYLLGELGQKFTPPWAIEVFIGEGRSGSYAIIADCAKRKAEAECEGNDDQQLSALPWRAG